MNFPTKKLLLDYSYLFNQLMEGILVTDLKNEIIYINDAAVQLVGTKDLITKPIQNFISQTENVLTKEGTMFLEINDSKFLTNFKPLLDKDGVEIGSLYSLPSSQKKLAELKIKLDKSLHDLDEFTYVISHDLKAPVRAINSLANWMLEDYKNVLDEKGNAQLDLLSDRAQMLSTQVEAVLHYSRIGRSVNSPKVIPLKPIFTQLFSELNVPENAKINIPENLPEIKGDEVKIYQMFKHLFVNAIDHNDKNEALEISFFFYEKKDKILFEIRDNGLGLKKKYHKTAFTIFQKHHIKKGFLGIGLPLARKIAEYHNGTIYIESEDGEGFSAFVEFPKSILVAA